MPGIQFDVDGARKAGYTDAEIAETLAKKAGFDVMGARQAGYGDSDIIARLSSAPAPQAQQTRPQPQPQAEVEDPGVIGSMVIGAGRTMDRLGKGAQQIYHGVMGNDKELANLKQQAANDDEQYKKLQNIRPFATGVGEAVPSLVAPGSMGATALGTMGRMALINGGMGAAEYGTAEERLKKGAGDAAGAVVGGVVIPKAVGMAYTGTKGALKGLAGNVTPEALQLAARAKELGIPVNAAQLGDSKFLKTLSSAIEQMPFTGGAKAGAEQRTAFTKAVAKTFGEDADKVTPEVYAAAKSRLGQQFDDLAMRNTLNLTDDVISRLQAIRDEAAQMADDTTIKAVDSSIDRLIKQSNPGNNGAFEVPGAAYSSIDSMLSKNIKAGGEKGDYLKRVQNEIREAMDKSISPADQAAWKETRTQYKNMKAVRDAVAKDSGNGDIPPSLLLSGLNSSEAGKEAMAMGTRGELGDLGRIGKQFVRDQVPNSGTAQRAMAMGLIGGGGYAFGADPAQIVGMMAGGATAGRIINKVLQSPKVLEALGKKGITVKDMANLPPDVVVQKIGAALGMGTVEDMRN